MNLQTTLQFFFDLSQIPLTLQAASQPLQVIAASSFEPNLAVHFASAILDESVSLDMTITKDFLMAGYVRNKSSGQIIFVGPAMEYPCTKKISLSVLHQVGQPETRADELLRWMDRIPRISIARFLKHLYFLHYVLNDEEPPAKFWDDKLRTLFRPDIDLNAGAKVVHNSQAVEQHVHQMIEHGKINELTAFLKGATSLKGNMGKTANDTLRAYKNIFVSSVALTSRSAIKAGLDYEVALDASDSYLQEMENLDNVDSVYNLWVQMLLDFTAQVARIRRMNATSYLVHQVIGYITRHIDERILIDDMAVQLGYNRSYLCRAFRQETGKKLSNTINEIKIEEAKYLLASTDKSVTEVTVALGFSTQNLFHSVFKSFTGVTPSQFRKNSHS